MEIQATDLDDLYSQAIKTVFRDGEEITVRGLTCTEILFPHLILKNPRARLIQNKRRNISKKFTMAEFIWTMSGQDSLETIEYYNKRIRNFSDDGITLHGAYGPRLRDWRGVDQLRNVVEQLKADLFCRQAVIVIIDPARDLVVKTKDVPCNDFLQFLVRDDKINMSCYVRSNDLNWGFPYDIFHWTMLQEMLARELEVELGEYHHFVGSLHIYDKDYEYMKEVASTATAHIPMTPMPINGLGIISSLERAEETFRKTGSPEAQLNKLPIWWKDKFEWITG